jgi:peptidoglycan/LPS O-acetylase OafA/YrhL
MGILRFILALSVVAAHCGPLFNITGFIGGSLSVQCFFMISGFYMSLILTEKYNKINNGYFTFITNRLLRLYPLYWTILILTGIFFLLLGIKQGSFTFFEQYNSCNIFSLAYVIFSEIFVLFQDLILFVFVEPDSGNLQFTINFKDHYPALHKLLLVPQAWSLGIEILFYLIAPYLTKKSNLFLIIIIGLSMTLRLILFNSYNLKHDPWTYRFFLTEICFFLLGILSFRIYKNTVSKKTFPLLTHYFTVAIIILITTLYKTIPDIRLEFISFTLKGIVFIAIIFIAIPYLFHFFKNSKFDNAIGELSYPIYISHILVMLSISIFIPHTIWSGTLITLITILLSLALNHFISRPIDQFRNKRVSQNSIPSSNRE